MTMVKFKKGDRVIVLSTPDTPYAGKTGVITGDWGEGTLPIFPKRFDVRLDDGSEVWFDENEISKEEGFEGSSK